MQKSSNTQVNQLPVSTWNQLRVNYATIEMKKRADASCDVKWEERRDNSCLLSKNVPLLLKMRTGMGPEVDSIIKNSQIRTNLISTQKNSRAGEPVRLQLEYKEDITYVNHFTIHAVPGSEITVIMDYYSENDTKAFAITQIHMYAEKNAKIRFIQVQRLGEKMIQLNDLGSLCEENAEIEIIQADFGAGQMYAGSFTELAGNNSKVNIDIEYQGKRQQQYDMNYIVNHYGKRSESNICVNGILEQQANKVFRGTIDFKKRAKGSVGEETEEVLLIGDNMINKTVPLILCEEEDVQGNHGASIGRLDEEVVFYLESRGIKAQEVYNLIADAKIDLLCEKIKDQKTEELLKQYKRGAV